jgi:hypothetical protein
MFGRSEKVQKSTSFLLFASSPSIDAVNVGQERACIHLLAALRAHSLGYRQQACLNPRTGLVRDMLCCPRLHYGIVILAAGPSQPLVKLTFAGPSRRGRSNCSGTPRQAATGSFLSSSCTATPSRCAYTADCDASLSSTSHHHIMVVVHDLIFSRMRCCRASRPWCSRYLRSFCCPDLCRRR